MSLRGRGPSVRMRPLFSLLLLLHLLQPSLLFSFKNCSASFSDQSQLSCNHRHLAHVPKDIPKTATSLSVYSNDIQSVRLTDFCGFTRLQSLDMGCNNISHTEHGAFSDLSALTSLSLSYNKLTNLTDHMFKGLLNLSSLDLRENKIGSVSKFAFEPLKNLRTLTLSQNFLFRNSDVANIVLHCPSLEMLDLGDNKLSSLQSSGLPFPVLKILTLAGNNITVFDAENVPFVLLNLTKLFLGSNPLREFSLHSDVLPHLHELDLTFSLESTIHWDVSDKRFLRNLTVLHLDGTNLTIETYHSLFQIVHSVKRLYLPNIGRLFDKGLLDLACEIPSLQMLFLWYNNIVFLNNSVSQPCNNLTVLDLTYNSITDLADSSLQMLTGLKDLILESNKLSRIPVAVRNMINITILSFSSNHITELGCSDFLSLSSLTSLSVYDNNISKLRSCVFRNLKRLFRLDVGQNHLLKIDNSFDNFLPNLVHLRAEDNNIGWLHKGTFRNMSSLTYLDLKSSGVTLVEGGAFEGLHNLQQLSLSTNKLKEDMFAGLSSLENLSMSLYNPNNCQLSKSESIFNLPSLRNLEITVKSETCFFLDKDVFKGLNNLITLKSHRFLCFTPHKDTFSHTPHLVKLEHRNNFEFEPDPELFHPLTELEILRMPENKIKSLDFLFEANLTKLEKLELQYNESTVIDEAVFEKLPSLKYLDIFGNPFLCNCSNIGFIEWVIRNKHVQVANAFQYRCSSPLSEEGHFLLDFNVQSCWEFTGFLCFISTSALVLLTLLSSFIYHLLRWQLVYGYYLLLAFLYDSKKRRQGCPHIYDAFVSYNVHDEEWVFRELVPELEGRQGWRLCLHHRDFQPGKPIIENITDAIYSSRKTLCVISRRYLQSEWCSREIQLASYRLFDERKDVLILLFLEEISSNQLSPFYRMRKLVKSRTYLSWAQARSHKGLFWEKVRRALESGNEPGDNNNPLTADA